ncbi:MAG: ATP-binding protein [Planctomycetota bacterium]
MKKNLEQIWDQLRSQKPSRENYLEEVQLKGLRGIRDLRVSLPFPVTVLAGPNGCGKSTILFALACAYKSLGRPEQALQRQVEDRTPTKMFPVFDPRRRDTQGELFDIREAVEITFAYVVKNDRQQMKWARPGDKWNRSFLGRKGAEQPERDVYLRTLANLSNPSELRSVLQLARRDFETEKVDASNIAFAQRILSYRYSRLSCMRTGLRSLLFAERAGETGQRPKYSEFHMSAGERAILRLSRDVSRKDQALILIDEVEAGLHPYVQQLLMLELQRLALRNKLQIVVTTHSPAVLDTVPTEARVFLERTEDNVVRREPYRDLIQKALYGRTQSVLAVLCEDEMAEAFIRGLLDFLGPKLDLLQNDIEVGRDTGKDQFPLHLETLARFRKLPDVLFVLDGDGREVGQRMSARAAELGQALSLLYLPGNSGPEVWLWAQLKAAAQHYAAVLSMPPQHFVEKMEAIDNLYDAAADKPSAIAKGKVYALAEATARAPADLVRLIAKKEAETKSGDVYGLANDLEDVVRKWRSFSA